MIKELVRDPEELCKSKLWKVTENYNLAVELIQNLSDTLKEYPDRLFLCTNEIGYKERGILMKFKDDEYEFFDPSFQKRDKIFINREKDIITGDEYLIPRFSDVVIVYQDCLGKVQAKKLNEAASVVMCQAMDMLNGITAKDYGLPILDGFDDLSDEDKSELISEYIQGARDNYNSLDKELSGNSEVSEYWGAAKYIRGVADGKVEQFSDPPSKREQKRLKKIAKAIKDQSKRLKFWRK